MSDWDASDPRETLVDRKHARLVILRPHPNGNAWEAGTAHAEMKHGWHIATSFADRPLITEAWDPLWRWTLAPE